MKKYLLLVFFIFKICFSHGQKNTDLFIPYNQNHKWGFATINGDLIIKPIFDSVGLFDDDFAEAYKSEKVGLINKKGEWIVPPLYRTVRVLDLKKKLFEVSVEIIENDSSSWYPNGIYQQNVGLLTPINFYSFQEFNSHKYALEGRDEKNYLLDLRTRKISKLNHKHYFDCGCGRAYRQEELEKKQYKKYLKTRPPLEELNELYLFRNNNKVGGYIVFDTVYNVKTKKWIKYIDSIPAIYDTLKTIDYSDNELFYAKKDKKWGVLNTKAKNIIDFIFDTIIKKDFEDYFLVRKGNKYGVYSTKGEKIFDCEYEKIIMPCGSNKISLGKRNGKWIAKSTNGQFITATAYDTITTNCYGGNNQFIKIKDGDKFGIIDTSGKSIYPIIYDELIFRDTFLIYKLKNVYGVKNIKTNEDVIKAEWDLIYFRNDSYFIVKRNEKYGVIIPPNYETKRQYFPLADTDDIEVVRQSFLSDKKEFMLFGIYQDTKYFYLGENGVKFTNY